MDRTATWRTVGLVAAPFAALLVGIVGILVAADQAAELARDPLSPGFSGFDDQVKTAAGFVLVGLGCLAMLAGWRAGLARWGEAVATTGAWLVILVPFLDATGNIALAIPAFLLPWLLLVVELPAIHRLLLLAMQWLATVALVSYWTGESPPTTLLLAVSLIHALLVAASLPKGQARSAALVVSAGMVAVSLLATLFFLVREPTLNRVLAALVLSGVLGAVAWSTRGAVERLRLPTLVRQRVAAAPSP